MNSAYHLATCDIALMIGYLICLIALAAAVLFVAAMFKEGDRTEARHTKKYQSLLRRSNDAIDRRKS